MVISVHSYITRKERASCAKPCTKVRLLCLALAVHRSSPAFSLVTHNSGMKKKYTEQDRLDTWHSHDSRPIYSSEPFQKQTCLMDAAGPSGLWLLKWHAYVNEQVV